MKTLMKMIALPTIFIGLMGCEQESAAPVNALTDQEQADLIFMFEEEKLARDTYLHLATLWSEPQFANIAQSEQKHMDAIGVLCEAYGVPFTELEKGLFENAELQQLYNDLIAQGELSAVDALTVGATIEVVDIVDLNERAAHTTHADIRATYENLACGSRNHLRAFVQGLGNYEAAYTPQFLTQAEYDAILAGSHENCGGN